MMFYKGYHAGPMTGALLLLMKKTEVVTKWKLVDLLLT
jgi:hypothetical protein